MILRRSSTRTGWGTATPRLTLTLAVTMAVGAAACAPPPGSSTPATTKPPSSTTTTIPAPPGPVSCSTDFSVAPPGMAAAGAGVSTPAPLDDETLDQQVDAASASSESGLVEVTSFDDDGRPEFHLVEPDAVSAIAATEAVTSVEAPLEMTAMSGTPDPLRAQLWGLDDATIEDVYHCSTGAGITVAVIDTGVQANHPDLAGRVVAGPAYLNGGPEVPGGGGVDPEGHGTHVAGTIAAVRHNGIGIAGVAPGATILGIRSLDANGNGLSTDVARGINYAVDEGVDVINLSLGSPARSGAIRTAVDRAWDEGIVVIAAAGNTPACSNPCWPGAEPNTIAVAAHNSSRQTAGFSVNGSWLDVSAPGVGIVSTYPFGSGYASSNGTSMAAPHVAGLAALMVATDSSLTPEQIRGAIRRGAIDIGSPGFDNQSGFGAVDAKYTWLLHAAG